jgi:hypothetical protein
MDDVETEGPRRTVIPLEWNELFGLALETQHRASRLHHVGQHAVEQRPGETERRAAEVGVRAVRVHGAEQQGQDFAIGRIGDLFEVVQPDLRRFRLGPLAVLAALTGHQIDREDAARKRGGAVDRVDQLRAGEQGGASRTGVGGQMPREVVEKSLPGLGCLRCAGCVGCVGCAECAGCVGCIGCEVRKLRIVVTVGIDRVDPRVGTERGPAQEEAAMFGLEQGGPDVFADLDAIEKIRTFARGPEPVALTLDEDSVDVRPSHLGADAPGVALDLRHGPVELIQPPLGPAPARHVAREDARQREFRGHPTSLLRDA